MLYALISQDIENSIEARLRARPTHIERLQQFKQQGRLIIAGSHPTIDNSDPGSAGFTESLIVAEFDSFDEAQVWADDDPYVHAGVYQSVVVKPFNCVLP